MRPRRWEHFRHGADIGVRGCAGTLEEAFAAVGEALTAVVTEPAGVRAEQSVTVRCEAPEIELLLVDWLNALVYEMAVRHFLFRTFDVRIEGTRLNATLWGEPLEVARHQPAVEVKGATYTALRVEHTESGWCAQCVVDV